MDREKERPTAASGPVDALLSGQTYVSVILAHDATPKQCVHYFLHDPMAPCTDLASRRTYALGAMYVASLLRNDGQKCTYDFGMLVTVLCSMLRLRRSTGVAIVHALTEAGMIGTMRSFRFVGDADE